MEHRLEKPPRASWWNEARAVLVKSQQETFAIPLDAVSYILRLEPEVVLREGGVRLKMWRYQ